MQARNVQRGLSERVKVFQATIDCDPEVDAQESTKQNHVHQLPPGAYQPSPAKSVSARMTDMDRSDLETERPRRKAHLRRNGLVRPPDRRIPLPCSGSWMRMVEVSCPSRRDPFAGRRVLVVLCLLFFGSCCASCVSHVRRRRLSRSIQSSEVRARSFEVLGSLEVGWN